MKQLRPGWSGALDCPPEQEFFGCRSQKDRLRKITLKVTRRALSSDLGALQLRAGSHDRGRVIGDLAVMLADGGDCLVDVGSLGDQSILFGDVASTATALRVIDQIASDPNGLG